MQNKLKNRMPVVAKTRALSTRRGKALAVKKRKRFPNRPLSEAQIRSLLSSIDSFRDVRSYVTPCPGDPYPYTTTESYLDSASV